MPAAGPLTLIKRIFPYSMLSLGEGRARNLFKKPSILSKIIRDPPCREEKRVVMTRMPGVIN